MRMPENMGTFTNTGEQQCVILYLEYHFGGESGISSANMGEPVRTEYFTLSGERVSTPTKGIYLVRIYNHQGKVESRKVIF